MNQFNTIANVVLALAVAALFFLHFSGKRQPATAASASDADSTELSHPGKIAYFEMDSVEQHYTYIKEVREKLKSKEQAITNELNSLRRTYAGRIQQFQQRAPNMSQQEGEAAQAEISQMEQNFQQREAKLAQELQEQQFKLMQDINKRIEDFLKDYNKEKKFAFIISHQPGDFIYYKDSLLDITADVIKGLNSSLPQTKGESPKKDN